jgi:AbrB family looped-hinge helix DNA binding protein
MKATVGERGQVTIPKALRESLGIRPGQRLEFHEEDGRLVATKGVPEDDLMAAAYGILRLPDAVDALLHEMRGPADLPPEA